MRVQRKSFISITFLICISLLSFVYFSQNNTSQIEDKEKLHLSGTWATLDLDQGAVFNETLIQTGDPISVQGRLWNRITTVGKDGYTVVIEVDGVLYPVFNDITSGGGYFQIDYNIDNSLNVFNSHRLEVKVTNPIPPGDVEYRRHYIIDVNTTSYFELYDPTVPKILGENLEFEGYLRYENGTGISFETLNYYWYDGPNLIYSDNAFTNYEGEINNLYIPDWAGDDLSLKFNYSNTPYIKYNQDYMLNTKIFSDISSDWNLPDPILENRQFRIRGQVLSLTNPSLSIGSRTIRILYNYSIIATVDTDANGNFDYTHQLSNGTGLAYVEIEIDGPSGILSTGQFINIEAAPPSLTPPPSSAPPFALFLSIFIPIIVGIVVGLSIYGYYYYKKKDKESRVVNLPLENRIRNLLILKDTGRLEESLSYLFNAIYLDLIQAKYGKTRNDNETIRDFAIISVKELNLSPTNIYPFIQKVEEIIYAKPYRISDIDFYKTIELFSPIYHELTGYNFVLN
jgi:hypothetical protein